MPMEKRITVIDAMRGLASFAVVWFHLAHEMGFTPRDTPLFNSGAYGWVGVEVFFVISGFVIPFALERSGYELRAYGRFLFKRIIRLDPPYLAAILLALAVSAYYAHSSGTAFPYSLTQVLLHLGYINVFFGYAWINPVFWTLAIELQYYVLIGLAFPIVRDRRGFFLICVPICLALAAAVHAEAFIFKYLPFFLLGLAAFHFRCRALRAGWFVASVFVFTIVAWQMLGWVPAAAGCLSALAIAFVRSAPKPLVTFGSISYSLYLVHATVGYPIGSAVHRRLPFMPPLGVVLISLAGSVTAAYVLYRLVERPAQRLSSRIHYAHTVPSQASP